MKNTTIMEQLFALFESSNIKYVHFKSNTNINESFLGLADFDVLVQRDRIQEIESIIISLRGRRYNTPKIGNYPGVDNWLLFDAYSGIIYHLHLHYQLITGKKLLKDYVLPWDNILFEKRIRDSKDRLYISSPETELLLLSVRIILKSKFYDTFRALLCRYRLTDNMQKEWTDLQKSCDWKELNCVFDSLLPLFNKTLYTSILQKERLSSRDYLYLLHSVRKGMKQCRRMGKWMATITSKKLQFQNIISKIRSRYLHKLVITKKVSLSGGKIITFIGVDGAGKSTVTNDITKWLQHKIEAQRFYMGVGDGHTTLFVSFLKRIHGKPNVNDKRTKAPSDKHITLISNPILWFKRYFKLRMICSVERNNKRKLIKIHQYRMNGGYALLDRYPQIEQEGQNDGPKVNTYRKTFGSKVFLDHLEKKETAWLSVVKTIKPDIVFRLNITPETSQARKQEQYDLEENARKIKECQSLTFQGATIIEIDAEQPYEEELLSIKRILWEHL